LGLAFFNATAGSRAVLRHMLHHAQRNMHVMFDDQQALNHQLVMVRAATSAQHNMRGFKYVNQSINQLPCFIYFSHKNAQL
jgi:hypothetical protein